MTTVVAVAEIIAKYPSLLRRLWHIMVARVGYLWNKN